MRTLSHSRPQSVCPPLAVRELTGRTHEISAAIRCDLLHVKRFRRNHPDRSFPPKYSLFWLSCGTRCGGARDRPLRGVERQLAQDHEVVEVMDCVDCPLNRDPVPDRASVSSLPAIRDARARALGRLAGGAVPGRCQTHRPHFTCPACEHAWTEEERGQANAQARLLYGDQSIDAEGLVTGEPPATDTLGFRWSAVHNLFLSAGDLAADEWRASRAAEQELAEREMRQFVWCLPVEASKWSQTPLEIMELAAESVPGRGAFCRPIPNGSPPPWTPANTCSTGCWSLGATEQPGTWSITDGSKSPAAIWGSSRASWWRCASSGRWPPAAGPWLDSPMPRRSPTRSGSMRAT